MELVLALILFPLVPAVLALFTKHGIFRGLVTWISFLVISAGSVWLLVDPNVLRFDALTGLAKQLLGNAGNVMLGVEVLVALFLVFLGVKYKKWLIPALVLPQIALMLYLELGLPHPAAAAPVVPLFFDQLSQIMALVIGVIGGLIAVYALGYMKDYHHHHAGEMTDRSNRFFALIFLFLSAMFGIVFSNNLVWLYFFWEITTLCSFLLIWYSRTDEARANAFRALTYNLIGGLAFSGAIAWLELRHIGVGMDALLAGGKAVALLPAILISFAGMTKSAQLPFSSWLLGAMVAPTPVSALLHSSTMVNAGVYVIIKFAPVLTNTVAGFFVSLVGGATFLLTALLAVAASNAKRLLAYSTISNLGLIVLCAGIGTYEGTWAAILLLVFHAIAKGLLFLCVGSIEHRIGSRDIEDMDGLVLRMPKTTLLVLIGIAGMFLAPFGMLLSKWAALRALVDAHPILAVLVAFGGAATLFFWGKWMGKLITVVRKDKSEETGVSVNEWTSLWSLGTLTVAVCALFPVLSSYLIEPYVHAAHALPANVAVNVLGEGNLLIMLIMLGLVFLLPLGLLFYGKDLRHITPYLGGQNVEDHTKFRNALGAPADLTIRNYYMEKWFGEKRLFGFSVWTALVLLAGLAVAGLFAAGVLA